VHPAHDADSPGATLPPHRVNSAARREYEAVRETRDIQRLTA